MVSINKSNTMQKPLEEELKILDEIKMKTDDQKEISFQQ
jgi:hypothetical protein